MLLFVLQKAPRVKNAYGYLVVGCKNKLQNVCMTSPMMVSSLPEGSFAIQTDSAKFLYDGDNLN
jgi:hypothetical protein